MVSPITGSNTVPHDLTQDYRPRLILRRKLLAARVILCARLSLDFFCTRGSRSLYWNGTCSASDVHGSCCERKKEKSCMSSNCVLFDLASVLKSVLFQGDILTIYLPCKHPQELLENDFISLLLRPYHDFICSTPYLEVGFYMYRAVGLAPVRRQEGV